MKVKVPFTGAICGSLQGRDKGNLYAVVQILPQGYVLLADGTAKKLKSPKKKNLKHLHIYPANVKDYGADVEKDIADSVLAYALKQFALTLKGQKSE